MRKRGLLCRDSANTPGVAGQVARNGVLAVYFLSDTAFTVEKSLGGISQQYQTNFVIRGRLRNLKNDNGVRVVRDFLYQSIIGVVLPGYKDQTFAVSFVTEPPEKNEWPFLFTFAAHALIVATDCSDPLFVDDIDDVKIAAGEQILNGLEFIASAENEQQTEQSLEYPVPLDATTYPWSAGTE